MTPLLKQRALLVALVALFFAPQTLAEPAVDARHYAVLSGINLPESAQSLAELLRSKRENLALLRALQTSDGSPTLGDLLTNADAESASKSVLRDDLWVELAGSGNALPDYIAWTPSGEDTELRTVPALRISTGQRVELSAKQAPNFPVYLLSDQAPSAAHFVDTANARLRSAGLQDPGAATLLKSATVETTRLERISLVDDKEPWSSGRAEMYLLVAGVFGANEPQIVLVDLPYLDYAERNYFPRQIIVDWSKQGYTVTNILLYEHDDNTSYQSLVLALIGVVGEIGSLAGYPVAVAIEEITGSIVSAMPSHWFANADDFVDALYTVEKGTTEGHRGGAAGNASVDYIPYTVYAN